ncbi:transglutaminaseTgpA domain-containing protein [Nocardioides sp. C4-1]|uniref:transglutaminase family protein n=1 Tax=Nocardioides sp. C4-1 TaxID=3151851 RepID=UPI003264CF2C
MSGGSPSTAGKALRLAWPIGMVLLGALVLATAWNRWTISLLFAVVAAVPLLLLRALVRAGLSAWFSAAMIALLSVMAAYLATTGAELTLEQTIRDVVPRLLTAPQPYDAAPDLLVGPLLLTALVSLLVGLRVDSRLRVEPVAGGAALYVAGMLLTAGRADPAGLVAVLVLVVALLGWVFLDEHGEPVRQRLAMAGPVSVVGVGVLAAVATLPVGSAFEPRDLVEAPTDDAVAVNPLAQLGAWANNPDVELLRVRGDEVPLRLVVLDRYDGRQWTATTRFEDIRSDGRTGLETGPYGVPATVQVEFAGLGGSWLPSPGTPTVVALPEARVDGGTTTLYTDDDTDGLGYQVTGSYDRPPDELLETARLPEDGLERYTELPTLPPPLADLASRLGADATGPYQLAVSIENVLRTELEQAPNARSGSALWRLSDFLLAGPEVPGGGVGTSEQFAAAFAVLARSNGLPTRVVVGFRPGEEPDDEADFRIVRGRDAFAWAEIYFDDLGWVPFSPTPDDQTFARATPVEATQPLLPEEAETGAVPSASASGTPDETPDPDAAGAGDAEAVPTSGDRSSGPSLPLVVGGGLAAALALLVLLRLGRRVRHARRGAAGAWAEVVDALRLSGLRPAPHEPADVVAAGVDARFGTRSAAIATLAERSAFGPPDTVSGSSADGAPRGRASLRRQVRDVRRRVRRATPLWRRWWWWLDPRVLLPAPRGATRTRTR